MNYARRNGVEDALGSSVNFFHQDCLSSEVRLNVDLDMVLTVLANGCYRWLASRLHGFSQSKPKGLYRKFVETSGAVEIEEGGRLVVSFDRRSNNPILREARLDRDPPQIPWLGNRRLEFVFTCPEIVIEFRPAEIGVQSPPAVCAPGRRGHRVVSHGQRCE